jgi:transcriptional regulator with PAS, ATPase and Fis domain
MALDSSQDCLVGSSPPVRKLLDLVNKVGKSDVAVLLQGESGTGKELVAKLIYSIRAKGQFVPVDCGALPVNLVESELFGHERGAFTGALSARPGLLQKAHDGTAFFDEVGELSTEAQVKLLRALQERQIRAVGSDRCRPCQFRLIAATNRNLAEEVKTGRFRLDLYFRINVITLEIPPLRERKDDIPALVQYFLAKAGFPHYRVDQPLLAALAQHEWPGNVRELENCIARLIALTSDEALHVEHLPRWGPEPSGQRDHSLPAPAKRDESPKQGMSLDGVEREAIERALSTAKGKISEAAKTLGINRSTLYRKRRQYGL